MIKIISFCTAHKFTLGGYSEEKLKTASDSLASEAQKWLEKTNVSGANIQISQNVCSVTGYGGGTTEIIVSTTAFITYDTTQAGPND